MLFDFDFETWVKLRVLDENNWPFRRLVESLHLIYCIKSRHWKWKPKVLSQNPEERLHERPLQIVFFLFVHNVLISQKLQHDRMKQFKKRVEFKSQLLDVVDRPTWILKNASSFKHMIPTFGEELSLPGLAVFNISDSHIKCGITS